MNKVTTFHVVYEKISGGNVIGRSTTNLDVTIDINSEETHAEIMESLQRILIQNTNAQKSTFERHVDDVTILNIVNLKQIFGI